MSALVPMPPQGFDELPIDQQIDYVPSLLDHIAASVDQVPLADWQRQLLEERLAAHRAAPDEARPWEEVLERLQRRLRHPPRCTSCRFARRRRRTPSRQLWYEGERRSRC